MTALSPLDPSGAERPLRVMVVEDDAVLCELLALHLSGEGYDVKTVGDGVAALALARSERFDVVVLDLMLPGKSGIEVCTELRAMSYGAGVVMVTARGSEADVVLGLDSGADDYVVKPVRPREIIARVRAIARRVPRTEGAASVIALGALQIDVAARRVAVGGAEVVVTTKEFDLLHLLAANVERVFTRVDILERIWETKHAGYIRNVDSHMMRLRRKLDAAGFDSSCIETVHGTGYRFTRTS